jgi:C4-type Zn-finger protein
LNCCFNPIFYVDNGSFFLQKDNPKTEFENTVVATDTITKSIVTDENVAAEEIDNTEVETKFAKTQNIQSNAASGRKSYKN